MNRIQNISGKLRILIFILLPLQIYNWINLGFNGHPGWRILVAPGHLYDSYAEIPGDVLTLHWAQNALSIWGALILQNLFHLYQQGILFTARNVRCIRWLGYLLMINWVLDYQIQSLLPPMALSTTSIVVGLLIIFVSWIMDEGRKIQEEQELTV